MFIIRIYYCIKIEVEQKSTSDYHCSDHKLEGIHEFIIHVHKYSEFPLYTFQIQIQTNSYTNIFIIKTFINIHYPTILKS